MPWPSICSRQGRRADEAAPIDIAIAGGRIVEIADRIAADAPEERLDGRLVIASARRYSTATLRSCS
jgi:dihydroorotase-like cyclic amidohydrolase